MTRHKPFVLGLTGSIAMGKSTTAQMFRAAGVPLWDADATVHRIYAPGGAAVEPLRALLPGAIRQGAVDRDALKDAIAADPTLLNRIERIVHPLVAADRMAFLDEATAPLVVLDIPLLYETGSEALCDAVLVVTAPEDIQRQRALARPGMTAERLDAILARQIPDSEKRAKADYVVDTSLGIEAAQVAVAKLIAEINEADHA